MDHPTFFAEVRKQLFSGRLPQSAVDGLSALLRANDRHGPLRLHPLANVMSQVHHETGGYMLPIKETVMPSHSDKNPSDATVIKRLDAAFKAGQLPWVSTPYWRDGAFGRGPIQISLWKNYEKLGKRLGIDLRGNPNLALDPDIGADIAVVGMLEGLFTGKKLGDYDFPSDLDAAPGLNPRRIVNGKDGTDAKVAKTHRQFADALTKAGYLGATSTPAPVPETPKPALGAPAIIASIRAQLDELERSL